MGDVRGRDILQRALTGQSPATVASAPLYMGLFCEPLRRRKLAEVYRAMAAGKAEIRLSFDDEMAARLEAWDRTYGLFRSPPDWMPCRWGPSRSQADGCHVTITPNSCMWHSADGRTSVDYDGAYNATATSSVDVWDKQVTISDDSDIEALVPLQGWESWLADGQGLMVQRAQQRWGDRFLLHGSTGTPFWGGYSVLGFAGLMRMVHEQPEVLEKLFARLLENRIAAIRAMREVGLRCLFVEECLTSADMISESDFARLVWPFLRDMLAAAADMGMLTVFYFCGEIAGRLPYLAQCPAHALAFEENKKNIVIDLAAIRKEVGPHKVLFGNLDVVVLRDVPRQAIFAEVAAEAQAAGQPFVASIGSPVTLDTAPERVSWLTEAARAVGMRLTP